MPKEQLTLREQQPNPEEARESLRTRREKYLARIRGSFSTLYEYLSDLDLIVIDENSNWESKIDFLHDQYVKLRNKIIEMAQNIPEQCEVPSSQGYTEFGDSEFDQFLKSGEEESLVVDQVPIELDYVKTGIQHLIMLAAIISSVETLLRNYTSDFLIMAASETEPEKLVKGLPGSQEALKKDLEDARFKLKRVEAVVQAIMSYVFEEEEGHEKEGFEKERLTKIYDLFKNKVISLPIIVLK